MRNRERWVADTLLELADTLAPALDPVNYWLCVADRYAHLIPSSSIRLAVFGVHDALPVVVNTDERLGEPAIGEFLAEEGPGIDCCESRGPVVDVRLDEATERWERLAPAALSLGFRTVHAFPFSRHEEVLGAVTILTTETTRLPEADVRIAIALADAATIGMLNHRAITGLTATSEQLQGALSSRVIIEQAKGLVSARLEIGTDDAFLLIRRYARSHNLRIGEVCESLVGRRTTAADLVVALNEHVMKANRRA
ncbi:ANTAR domain-containing protein [Amycolatopsis sp. WAC 01376]|uniref:ANTAR domain-containing protein n=1 Tax=Amycolatopsis sp. WAC 01376 TaxID=2203195 RepID=UPI000F798563|nr:ANTAR domain-containing protein [Amycolatopsis sp. WAC 01376]RSM66807.1 ANTAR domain-containing protein [Amycolatopsis sp. WAC 01376]